MKKIIILSIMTFILMSFRQTDFPINAYQHDLRCTFIQNRCKAIEQIIKEQQAKGELTDEYAWWYVQMLNSMDSCARELKQFKILFK